MELSFNEKCKICWDSDLGGICKLLLLIMAFLLAWVAIFGIVIASGCESDCLLYSWIIYVSILGGLMTIILISSIICMAISDYRERLRYRRQFIV